MAGKTIHVDIGPDGSTRIEAEGFSGKGCVEATAALEQALGSVRERARKPEYFRGQSRRVLRRNDVRGGRGNG